MGADSPWTAADTHLNAVLKLLRDPPDPWTLWDRAAAERRYGITNHLIVAYKNLLYAAYKEKDDARLGRAAYTLTSLQHSLCCWSADHQESSLLNRLILLAQIDSALGERQGGVTIH